MNLEFPQKKPKLQGVVPTPDQRTILEEPLFRRASVQFVEKHGGPIVQEVLQRISQIDGVLDDNTRVMVQRSPVVGCPSVHHWHLDYFPGTPGNMAEQLQRPVPGVIVNVQSDNNLSGTEFLQNGSIVLDAKTAAERDTYTGKSYFMGKQEVIEPYWCDEKVEQQLQEGYVAIATLLGNGIYSYDSRDFHRPPAFAPFQEAMNDLRFRMVVRLNTPPKDFAHTIPPPVDQVLPSQNYVYFVPETGANGKEVWMKHQLGRIRAGVR